MELYIHIPFCVQKCKYCDFLSAPATKQVQNAYMETLLAQIKACAKGISTAGSVGTRSSADETCIAGVRFESVPGMRPVSSIFIGGGTPSAIDCEWIERLMQVIFAHYCVKDDAEISMEVNPGTVTKESLGRYRAAGINRLSIGCQSTKDTELARLGRIHNFAQFMETYGWAVEVGFEHINVDLMSALPGQSLEDWKESLQTIVQLNPAPEHISAYSLIVEEGTPFYTMYEKGELALPEEDVEREMYHVTQEILQENGYRRYEISNYAKSGCECKHNCGYWTRKDYLGFGIGAASLYENVRFSCVRDLESYLAGGVNAYEDVQILSVEEQMDETCILGLRMTAGVEKKAFEEKFGVSLTTVYGQAISSSIKEGLLEEDEMHIWLNERGMDLSNYVMAKFLRA